LKYFGRNMFLCKTLYIIYVVNYKDISYLNAFVNEKYGKTRNFWKKKGFQEGYKFIWVEKEI